MFFVGEGAAWGAYHCPKAMSWPPPLVGLTVSWKGGVHDAVPGGSVMFAVGGLAGLGLAARPPTAFAMRPWRGSESLPM